MITLAEYLQQLAAREFQLGRCDCMLALADWVQERTSVDVGAAWRGRYSDADGYRALAQAEGGLVQMVGRVAALGVIEQVFDELQAGDIAVLNLPRLGATGAIRTQFRWAIKIGNGLWSVSNHAPVAAWRVV